jgi:hypothetical protein
MILLPNQKMTPNQSRSPLVQRSEWSYEYSPKFLHLLKAVLCCISKVDRSAAYATRYVAKNIVATGLADKCEIQVSYSSITASLSSV